MNTKVWYLPYFECVYHTRIIETFSNGNARMVHMVHTMLPYITLDNKLFLMTGNIFVVILCIYFKY